jgi:hypothetical protein
MEGSHMTLDLNRRSLLITGAAFGTLLTLNTKLFAQTQGDFIMTMNRSGFAGGSNS